MIYLDYQATTPLAPEAKIAMLPWLEETANPHSPHRMGRKAAAAIAIAEEQILTLLPDAGSGQLVFTSGATEALNLAIKGLWFSETNHKRKIVTLETEHAATLDSVQYLKRQGAEIVTLPVDADGIVDLEAAASAIDEDTALVTAMLVNNEIGVIQPISELIILAHKVGAPFLLDAVQGYGRISVPQNCDMIALSAHKIHGPIGVGALWIKKGLKLTPLLHGGHQQGGLRSGTLSPALCAGFGAAAVVAAKQQSHDLKHVTALFMLAREKMANWTLNGPVNPRWKGNLNLYQEGIDSARLIATTRNVAFSAGSACSSGAARPSHVLKAIGLSQKALRGSIRLGFGRYTTVTELMTALDSIQEAAAEQQQGWSAL
ncbi:MAG: cysteine desulfurase family protein [Zymomonas mobilis subsp. pomaceae]|uniref:Cysteine desulfurase n=1 Tax=Zymomonas mobilis subsp. pomaceae (strain ATCC 29192 / DSM 22645 / JCM 10191 / CCUG 17912 / NBRC 13757 / NCIMB 11200 / NRRL B-4491 / Barker I) TaxID=579138 RepID=F8EV21_ZYMMT|nr:cysteine desulfurase family protein [Zymomonas mobilis]AEI37309.1 aminotransferase class V [Zymomonas mobilis subsp. pomaceae ATCC 29192]MDX5948677.1 cysteine desulfurase family protein [Zymomonas mobilis subsp. pomaceae]GEB88482.1 cysteine desulfurase IscS [Zymomonas mobilis subsp. pomaceae]